MSRNRIQKLLFQPEYIEFKDNLLAEAPFIELDKCGEPVRQVYLGLTENSFIIASENVPDYHLNPSVKYNADIDLDTDGMDLEWIVPVGFIDIDEDSHRKIITVNSRTGWIVHYMISNIWGRARKDWLIWQEALHEIHNDPYSYTRCLFKNFEIPDKMYDHNKIERRRSKVMHNKALTLETLTNRVMNKMYEIQEDIETKSGKKSEIQMETSKRKGNLLCCTRDQGSQTDVVQKKRSKRSLKKGCFGFCYRGKAKQRPP